MVAVYNLQIYASEGGEQLSAFARSIWLHWTRTELAFDNGKQDIMQGFLISFEYMCYVCYSCFSSIVRLRAIVWKISAYIDEEAHKYMYLWVKLFMNAFEWVIFFLKKSCFTFSYFPGGWHSSKARIKILYKEVCTRDITFIIVSYHQWNAFYYNVLHMAVRKHILCLMY